MKIKRILIVLLVLVTVVQAGPHRRHKTYPHRSYKYHRSYYPSYYNHFRFSYGPARYYRPVVVTSVTKTVYPKNLVTLTADEVAADIKALNNLYARGLISEKDFERSKKTLLNRIGMSINPDANVSSTPDIIDQIELLNEMRNNDILTDREYRKQKNKLLAMI